MRKEERRKKIRRKYKKNQKIGDIFQKHGTPALESGTAVLKLQEVRAPALRSGAAALVPQKQSTPVLPSGAATLSPRKK